MAKKALTGLSSAMLGVTAAQPAPRIAAPVPAAPASPGAETIALTLKVTPAVYQRLKLLGVQRRQSNQAILSAALTEYLNREETN